LEEDRREGEEMEDTGVMRGRARKEKGEKKTKKREGKEGKGCEGS